MGLSQACWAATPNQCSVRGKWMQVWLLQPYRAKVPDSGEGARTGPTLPQVSWGSAARQGAKSCVCRLAAVCSWKEGHLTSLSLSFSPMCKVYMITFAGKCA